MRYKITPPHYTRVDTVTTEQRVWMVLIAYLARAHIEEVAPWELLALGVLQFL